MWLKNFIVVTVKARPWAPARTRGASKAKGAHISKRISQNWTASSQPLSCLQRHPLRAKLQHEKPFTGRPSRLEAEADACVATKTGKTARKRPLKAELKNAAIRSEERRVGKG